MNALVDLMRGDVQADRVVPPRGVSTRLTVFTAAAMAFLAVFSLAIALAAGRLADRWGEALAQGVTIQVTGEDPETRAAAVLAVLETTTGVRDARVLSAEEQSALLTPWFGEGFDVGGLPLPQLIDVTVDLGQFDAAGLQLRLEAEVPGAILDDHTRWREPLIAAAERLRLLAAVSLAVIAAATASMITLAARAALATNAQVIAVLRLVGAQDSFIARAFVRRFTLRALAGAALGAIAATIAIAALPQTTLEGGFLSGLGFRGAQWLWPFLVPFLAGLVAFAATQVAARRALRRLT